MKYSALITDDDWAKLPEHLREGVTAYIDDRRPVGGFLQAVIENNLRDAVLCADHTNRERLPDIVSFFYWSVPSPAWGSPEKYRAWINGDDIP